jgi:hypothetical protein
MHELVRANPRFGYRRIAVLLQAGLAAVAARRAESAAETAETAATGDQREQLRAASGGTSQSRLVLGFHL